MTHASWIAVAVLAAGLATSGRVAAQSAEAEVLFRDGRNLIKQGKLAAGCDKLEASERLETSVGTLLNLGDCREKLGKLASAWAAFRKAEATAKHSGRDDKRQAEAAKRAAVLEPRLTNLVIEVKQPVDGLVVRRDDVVVDRAVWNMAVPVDPEAYTIVAEAPGYKPWRTEVNFDGKLRRRVVSVPKLERAAVSSAISTLSATQPRRRDPAPPAPPPEPTRVIVTPPTETHVVVAGQPRHRIWSTTRGLAVGLGVVGAGVIGGGAYFGTQARDLRDQADARCPTATCNDAEGLRLNDRAQTDALRANICFAAGGVAVAGALVMWFAGKPSEHGTVVTPVIGDQHAGVSIGGSF